MFFEEVFIEKMDLVFGKVSRFLKLLSWKMNRIGLTLEDLFYLSGDVDMGLIDVLLKRITEVKSRYSLGYFPRDPLIYKKGVERELSHQILSAFAGVDGADRVYVKIYEIYTDLSFSKSEKLSLEEIKKMADSLSLRFLRTEEMIFCLEERYKDGDKILIPHEGGNPDFFSLKEGKLLVLPEREPLKGFEKIILGK